MGVVISEMGGLKKTRCEKEEGEFNLGYVRHEMLTRHLHRDVSEGLGVEINAELSDYQ